MRELVTALNAYTYAVEVMEWLRAGGTLPPDVDIGREAFDYSVGCFGPGVVEAFTFVAKGIVEDQVAQNVRRRSGHSFVSDPLHLAGQRSHASRSKSYARELASQLVDNTRRIADARKSNAAAVLPTPVMTLRKPELESACADLVQVIFQRETSIAESTIHAYRSAIIDDCMLHVDYIRGQGRDPNLLTRAVRYITEAHAIPPMTKDPSWFGDVLNVVVELAVPNSDLSPDGAEFLSEIRVGMFHFIDTERHT